ncbi:MAG TPA: hypothetical protein VFS39_14310, partial [Nitrospira sp.]|nr:hypothetical protein [Nitrospira sp.]
MATRVADGFLKAASLLLYGFWCFLVGHHGWGPAYLVPLGLIAACLAALRLPAHMRVNLVLVVVAVSFTGYASELVLSVAEGTAPVQAKMQWLPFQSGENY